MPNVRSILQPSNSPRPLHPKIKLKRELIVNEAEPDEKRDKSDEYGRYMLSQLLNDLDQLCNEQVPFIDRKVSEISETLSKSSIEESAEDEGGTAVEVETDYAFLKPGEFDWNQPKKETPEPVEESEESDGSNDDDSNM